MVSDPDDFDAKIAGWWVWGQSSWIGHGWCDGKAGDQIPLLNLGQGGATGRGVQQQRTNLPVEDKRPKVPDGGDVPDKRPMMGPHNGGRGVQQQRDQIPRCTTEPGGQGVSAQRVAVGEAA